MMHPLVAQLGQKLYAQKPKKELVRGGSNVVVAGRVVRSMGTGRLADASLRVERSNA
jgi:hypothetical protein